MEKKTGSTNGENIKQAFNTFDPALGPNYSPMPPTPGLGSVVDLTVRVPSRRFYSPEILTSYILMPKDRLLLNRWRRFFFDHDPLVGAVLEALAITPYSEASVIAPDKKIKQLFEDMLMDTALISKMPAIDLEYMKIGEVFPFAKWNDKKGYFDEIVILNPDYVQVIRPAFIESKTIIKLRVDSQLRNTLKSREFLKYTRMMNPQIVAAILRGEELDPEKLGGVITQIARKSSPYDLHGRSVIDRLFRLLMYEDKILEAMITIADNYIYPLKIFKLGDSGSGFIPDASHAAALRQLLEQARFDPNFAIIFHYALQVEVVGFSGSFVDLSNQFETIDKRKLTALGVGPELLQSARLQSLNAAMELYLTRLRAKRDKFMYEWIYPVLFKQVSKAHGFYRRTQAELDHGVRTTPRDDHNLIIPKLEWRKRLTYRDSSEFLQFLQNLWEKELVSADTLLSMSGLDFLEEVNKRVEEDQILERKGLKKKEQEAGSGGGGGIFGFLKRKPKKTADEAVLERFTFASVMKSGWSREYSLIDRFYSGEFTPYEVEETVEEGEYSKVEDVSEDIDLTYLKKSVLARILQNFKSASASVDVDLFNAGRAFASDILHKSVPPMSPSLVKYYLFNIPDNLDEDRNLYIAFLGYLSALDELGYFGVFNLLGSAYEYVMLSSLLSGKIRNVGFVYPDLIGDEAEITFEQKHKGAMLAYHKVPAPLFNLLVPLVKKLATQFHRIDVKVVDKLEADTDFSDYVSKMDGIKEESVLSNMVSLHVSKIKTGAEPGVFVVDRGRKQLVIGFSKDYLFREGILFDAVKLVIEQLPSSVVSKLTNTPKSADELFAELLLRNFLTFKE